MSVTGFDTYRREALRAFGHRRVRKVRRIVAAHSPHFTTPLLLAIGMRESLLTNKVGYDGHDRGVYQINDYYGEHFLRHTRGCRSGSYVPIYKTAFPSGRVPTMAAGLQRALYLLNGNYQFAKGAGVHDQFLIAFSVAAYNCGASGALEGYRAGNVDHNTAHGDYSKDVLLCRDGVAKWLNEHKW